MLLFCSRIISVSIFLIYVSCTELWEEWWGYNGVSGPDFWGTHNKNWSLCGTGRFQSPINIEPDKLIYDPNLNSLQIDYTKVHGVLINTGVDLTIEIGNYSNTNSTPFVFTGGPMSYTYRLSLIKVHFGSYDEIGSEHLIAGKQFPLEPISNISRYLLPGMKQDLTPDVKLRYYVQLIGYNTDLYKDFREASLSTHGLAVITVLAAIDDYLNVEFDKILTAAKNVRFRGMKQAIQDFAVRDIIPQTELYITYEGSLTQPSCQETVTWIIINKPLRITKHQMAALRELNRWNQNDHEKTPLVSNNFRPPQHLYRRPVRTNISPYTESEECALKITKSYKEHGASFNESMGLQKKKRIQQCKNDNSASSVLNNVI